MRYVKADQGKLLLVSAALASLGIFCRVLSHSRRVASSAEPVGNVCILLEARATSPRLSCTDVRLFHAIYPAIGINRDLLIKLIDDNGIDSSGRDRSSGKLLVPGYPLYSRLGFSALDNVYLKGEDLQLLIGESRRALALTRDPVVMKNLEQLIFFAGQAEAEGKVLRIFPES